MKHTPKKKLIIDNFRRWQLEKINTDYKTITIFSHTIGEERIGLNWDRKHFRFFSAKESIFQHKMMMAQQNLHKTHAAQTESMFELKNCTLKLFYKRN